MQTAIDFVAFCLGFLPYLSLVAIACFAFWILTKMIPSLGAWMTNTDDMGETEAQRYEREYAASHSYDQYI